MRSLLPRLLAASFAASAAWNGFEVLWVHGVLGLPGHQVFADPGSHSQHVLRQHPLLGWLCLYFFYHSSTAEPLEIERFRLMTSVKEAELRAQSQVNPHFIFNSLNSLRR